ncbi:nuclease-related domain-containing protein [Paucihalobacter sp.]|uniref:nuclease-related domain-containing protein n=1 Tax=Paucihalobacter sp. TaxID=2850405 RepID=UPI003D16119C
MSNPEVVLWLLIATLAVVIVVSIFNKIRNWTLIRLVTSRSRGTKSERDLALKLLNAGIASQHIFHDLYLRKRSGRFAQIDLLVITKIGIIVFEVKDYSGWIFGNGSQTQWTQVLAYGKRKYRFYNPIKQNQGHIEALKHKLKYHIEVPFYSVIVFYGDCVLKDISYVPNGTFIAKSNRVKSVIKHIIKTNEAVIYKDKTTITGILQRAVRNGDDDNIKHRHSADISDLLGKHRIFD